MWMKVDDGLHAHRKTRAVTKSHNDKRRDSSAMGLWVLAGSWSAQNNTDGWVPEDELDRWDDDWKMLADRLVRAGYWWPQDRDGEPGYGFNDWLDYNPESEAASRSGVFGNHVRWHQNKGVVDPECEHCPQEPDDPESVGESPPESGTDRPPMSPPESGSASGRIALPGPTRPNPTRPQSSAAADAAREFDEFWAIYPKRRSRAQAAKAYRGARKRADHQAILDGLRRYVETEWRNTNPDYIPYPATWLNGDRWADEIGARPQGRPLPPAAHELTKPPDGLSPEEYAVWEREQRERRRA